MMRYPYFTFPDVVLGATVCGARKITHAMFYTGARTLANRVTTADLRQGTVFPELCRIRQISESIASAVCRVDIKEGLARVPEPDDILTFIQNRMYHPDYQDDFG